MKITLHPTEEIVEVDDNVEARVWVGMTENDIPVRALIVGVNPQITDPPALAVFERELRECHDLFPGIVLERQELPSAATAALNPFGPARKA